MSELQAKARVKVKDFMASKTSECITPGSVSIAVDDGVLWVCV